MKGLMIDIRRSNGLSQHPMGVISADEALQFYDSATTDCHCDVLFHPRVVCVFVTWKSLKCSWPPKKKHIPEIVKSHIL